MTDARVFHLAHDASAQSDFVAYFELSDLPPTTNTLFFNAPGKGRRLTPQYRNWRHSAGWELKLQRVKPIVGPVRIAITLPDRPGRAPDIDNTAKALIDLMVAHRILPSDDKKTLRELALRWERTAKVVAVCIRAAAAPETVATEGRVSD